MLDEKEMELQIALVAPWKLFHEVNEMAQMGDIML